MTFKELIELGIHSLGASYLESMFSVHDSTLGFITNWITYLSFTVRITVNILVYFSYQRYRFKKNEIKLNCSPQLFNKNCPFVFFFFSFLSIFVHAFPSSFSLIPKQTSFSNFGSDIHILLPLVWGSRDRAFGQTWLVKHFNVSLYLFFSPTTHPYPSIYRDELGINLWTNLIQTKIFSCINQYVLFCLGALISSYLKQQEKVVLVHPFRHFVDATHTYNFIQWSYFYELSFPTN